MSKEISNYDDIIDSRDVIERIAELEAERFSNLEESEKQELIQLQALDSEASAYAPEWQYGETLIRDSYFEDYARELVEEIGTYPAELPEWVVIDWAATASCVQQDYFAVEFDGVTYWVR